LNLQQQVLISYRYR